MHRSLPREFLLLMLPVVILAWAALRPRSNRGEDALDPSKQGPFRLLASYEIQSVTPLDAERGGDTRIRLSARTAGKAPKLSGAWNSLGDVYVTAMLNGKRKRIASQSDYSLPFTRAVFRPGTGSTSVDGAVPEATFQSVVVLRLRDIPPHFHDPELHYDLAYGPANPTFDGADVPAAIALLQANPNVMSISVSLPLRAQGANGAMPTVSHDPGFDIREIRLDSVDNGMPTDQEMRLVVRVFPRGPRTDTLSADIDYLPGTESAWTPTANTPRVLRAGGGIVCTIQSDFSSYDLRPALSPHGKRTIDCKLSVNHAWPRHLIIRVPDHIEPGTVIRDFQQS